MRKALLIGLIICVLAVGGIGAAFATNLGFPSIGALSLGFGDVADINCDHVGFHLASSMGAPVTVDGVYLSFDRNITNAAFSVSLRGTGDVELAYCALNSHSQTAGETRCFQLTAENSLPSPAQVYAVKVTVAENSVYNAPPASGWVIGP